MSETDAAWLAGILDGEGTLGVYNQGGYPLALLRVPNTDKRIVDRVATLTGGTALFHKSNKPRNRDTWSCRVTTIESLRSVLPRVIPYMVGKREQAELLLEFVGLVKPDGWRFTVEQRVRREEIRQQLSLLNSKGRED